jgi:Bacterial regulatory protein, Fis family
MPVQLPIEEAAARLGIHPATLRRRLKRGQVRGVREETPSGIRWLIEVDGEPAEAPPTQGAPDATATLTLTLERDALAQEVRRLSDHVDDLRTQLESRTREVSELHVILAQATRVAPAPALAAPEQPLQQPLERDDAAPTQEQIPRLGWWTRLSGWLSGA